VQRATLAPVSASDDGGSDGASDDTIEYAGAEPAMVVAAANTKNNLAFFWLARPAPDQRSDASCPDGSGPLLPQSIDMTVFTTTKSIDPAQVTAIRSWLLLGADVIVMIDNVADAAKIAFCTVALASGQDEPWRLRVLETPKPRGDSGAPHMDLVFDEGERLAKTKWLAYVNGDIVLPRTFARLVKMDEDKMFFGGRLDCRPPPALKTLPSWVASFEDFERFALAPCWPHGAGGKDYYVYQKGFWRVRLPCHVCADARRCAAPQTRVAAVFHWQVCGTFLSLGAF